ncbi:MAG: FecR domain-containing protein [Rikenellaceae bacterium]|nr:FecR domain-containing protein [Rikenellaceae bacterium]
MEEQIKRITRLLIRKTEGNLTQAETQELEDWLGESAHNRRMLEELENKSLNTRLFTEYLSVHSSRACRNVEKRLGRKTPSRKRMLWGALLGAACSAVLAWLIFLEKNQENPFRDFPVLALMPASSPALHFDLGGGEIILEGTSIEMLDGKMLLQRPGMEPLVIVDTGNNYREQPLHTTIEIPKGTQYSITLENGTRVWLNAETRLKYPLVFRKQAREVELSGEAFSKWRKIEAGRFGFLPPGKP